MSKLFTQQEVAKHNSSKSLWVVFNDRVYDITEFAKDHPGGDDFLLQFAGKDITEVMSDKDYHEHSEASFEILQDYMIGRMDNKACTRRLEGQRASLHRKRIALLEKEIEYKTFTEDNFHPSLTDAHVDIKTNQFLDLNKPLVPQMITMKFTREHYLEQVHKPRYLNRPANFFGHPLLEPFSKTYWWVVPLVWLPYVVYNIHHSLLMNQHNTMTTGSLFLLGVFIWTFLEYALHRFLFHYDDRMPENQFMFLLHFVLHGFHHYLPMDRARLVVPPALLVVLAYPWITLAHILFPSSAAFAIVAGGMFGYVCYDMTHYYVHHAKVIPFHFKEMKKYHLAHHYKDFEAGYGITSKFWDYVFNTVLAY
ncbi:Inositolphosphorylceramide-B hydroxylase [Rhizopus microsporus var. microsporus]|uniref:Ceramide very long chain fatty acid hydroxylase n=2 Tax=Rhizopus microsporus TaxID=58291 RepID=A0A2G4SZP9_RHIZD|nr:Inositolphosphorylceramide-B hydroxylase [Rhizopus microsporus ATCC 52813]ORE12085.1 Inositolphosphorylceramide-B hydroxylase [Rhizopus microsporus var. microsporus]PHZ14224.1 Inositolphosphorylceramide-B hydroxylase [Rhizopus microsporus ATCC 52813]